jgi:hypothetical protein
MLAADSPIAARVARLARRAGELLRVPAPHEWLLLVILLAMTQRYFWLMDDAFIYFRYVDNLLFLHRGLTWNPGEYVEGYSSPVWLFVLAGMRALSLDYQTIVRVLGLACAGGFGCMLIAVNRELSPPGPIVSFPLAASAAHYGLTTHFTSGLETPLVQAIAPVYALALLNPARRWAQLAIAASPLVRPELALPALLFCAWLAFVRKRVPWAFLLAFSGLNGAWLAFRVYYYADFLPNTFYLKDAANWQQGAWYARNVLEAHHWPLVIALLAGCAWLGRHARALAPPFARSAMLCIAAAYGLYVVRIGGDMLYHRYAAFPVSLGLCASGGVCEAALTRVRSTAAQTWLAPLAALIVALAFGAGYPAQLEAHPLSEVAHDHRWHKIADASWHRRRNDLMRSTTPQQDASRRERYAQYAAAPARELVITSTGWCRSAYERFDARVVHAYGLTDPFLARVPGEFGRPGHKFVQDKAEDLVRLEQRAVNAHRRPIDVRYWLKLRRVPRWIRRNADGLLLLERKIHNQHALVENLELALTHVQLR